jgi:hypothetical protein
VRGRPRPAEHTQNLETHACLRISLRLIRGSELCEVCLRTNPAPRNVDVQVFTPEEYAAYNTAMSGQTVGDATFRNVNNIMAFINNAEAGAGAAIPMVLPPSNVGIVPVGLGAGAIGGLRKGRS